MYNTKNERLKGTVYVLFSAVCFSLGGILIKLLPWASLTIQGLRSVFSLIAIALYMGMTHHKFRFNRSVAAGALLNFIMATAFVIANKMTTAANAIVLQFTEPVFVILLLWIFYHKKPAKEAIITCLMVLAGIVCFFFDSLSAGGMLGNVIALISGITYAGFFLIKQFPEGDFESSMILALVLSILASIPSTLTETQFGPALWIIVMILGAVQSGLSYIFLSKGLDRISPVAASLTSTIEPILNPILVAVFYGEQIGMLSFFGAVLVIGSATVYNVWSAHANT